jgi:hypothetical protein
MRKLTLTVVVLAGALLGTQASLRADFITTATLLSAKDVPPHVTPAFGFAEVKFIAATDELDVFVSFHDLSSPATAAHIHFGGPTVNGPIILPFPSFPNATDGTYSTILTAADLRPNPGVGINTFADAVNAIQTGNTYVNIHDAVFPGGEIRGQLSLIPEPASLISLAIGAGGVLGLSWVLRRRGSRG